MNDNPYDKLANMFEENRNKNYLGALLAEVIEPLPNLKLKLLNGAMEIDRDIEGDNIFIARSITNRLDIDITFKDFESVKNIHETIKGLGVSGVDGAINFKAPVEGILGKQTPPYASLTIPNYTESKMQSEISKKGKGKLKIQTIVTLKKGEKVLVIPNETEDQFFIVDVFDPLKEVELEWEYYQK